MEGSVPGQGNSTREGRGASKKSLTHLGAEKQSDTGKFFQGQMSHMLEKELSFFLFNNY